MVFKRAVARVRSLRGAEVGGMRLHHRAAAPHLPPRHAAGAAHAAPGGARLPREAHVQRHGGGGLTLHVVGSSHAARLATVRVQRAVCTGSAKYPGEDGDFSALRFTRFANWLVPGSVMLGRYPYVEPGPRCRTTAQGDLQLEQIVGAMDASRPLVVLCLQAELPSQSAEWTEPLVLKKGDDAFLPYYQPLTDAAAAAGHASTPEFMHFGVEDFHTPTLPALQGLVVELAKRLEEDSAQLYIHCWGGRGRAGTVGAALLSRVYEGMDAKTALALVQGAYSTRDATDPQRSPETESQRALVRRFYETGL